MPYSNIFNMFNTYEVMKCKLLSCAYSKINWLMLNILWLWHLGVFMPCTSRIMVFLITWQKKTWISYSSVQFYYSFGFEADAFECLETCIKRNCSNRITLKNKIDLIWTTRPWMVSPYCRKSQINCKNVEQKYMV